MTGEVDSVALDILEPLLHEVLGSVDSAPFTSALENARGDCCLQLCSPLIEIVLDFHNAHNLIYDVTRGKDTKNWHNEIR